MDKYSRYNMMNVSDELRILFLSYKERKEIIARKIPIIKGMAEQELKKQKQERKMSLSFWESILVFLKRIKDEVDDHSHLYNEVNDGIKTIEEIIR